MKKERSRKSTTTNKPRTLTKQEEELKKIHQKYHPQENDKSLKVDDEYKKRLEDIFGIKVK